MPDSRGLQLGAKIAELEELLEAMQLIQYHFDETPLGDELEMAMDPLERRLAQLKFLRGAGDDPRR